jgi:hypothetical protein
VDIALDKVADITTEHFLNFLPFPSGLSILMKFLAKIYRASNGISRFMLRQLQM